MSSGPVRRPVERVRPMELTAAFLRSDRPHSDRRRRRAGTGSSPRSRSRRPERAAYTVAIGESRVRAGAEQQPRRSQIVFAHGPVQRRRAVRAGRVDVHSLREQHSDGCPIPFHHRFREPPIALRTPIAGSSAASNDAITSERPFPVASITIWLDPPLPPAPGEARKSRLRQDPRSSPQAAAAKIRQIEIHELVSDGRRPCPCGLKPRHSGMREGPYSEILRIFR